MKLKQASLADSQFHPALSQATKPVISDPKWRETSPIFRPRKDFCPNPDLAASDGDMYPTNLLISEDEQP